MHAPILLLALAAATWADDVVVRKDVSYLGPDRVEKLDLYLPAAEPKPGETRPAVVIIHGGGWTGGDKGAKREIEIGTTLAQHGYVCASINYVLAKPASPTWPDNLKDCKRAVRWLRKNAAELHVDPEHIGAIGGSAGGHLTAMLAVTDPSDGFEPAEDPGVSTRVQAAVPMYAHMAAGFDRDHSMFKSKLKDDPETYRLAAHRAHHQGRPAHAPAPRHGRHDHAHRTLQEDGRQAQGDRRPLSTHHRRRRPAQLRPQAPPARPDGPRRRLLRRAPQATEGCRGPLTSQLARMRVLHRWIQPRRLQRSRVCSDR